MEHNFKRYSVFKITSFRVPYDYESIMHYGPYAFSKNGQPTIVPRVSQMSIYFWYKLVGFQAEFVVFY
jgi:hypothetical protein